VFTETPSDYVPQSRGPRKAKSISLSPWALRFHRRPAKLTEVRWGEGPAYEAGLTMGTALIAVNGREEYALKR